MYLSIKPYRDSGLLEIEAHGERLAHKHVGVVTRQEGALKLLDRKIVKLKLGLTDTWTDR